MGEDLVGCVLPSAARMLGAPTHKKTFPWPPERSAGGFSFRAVRVRAGGPRVQLCILRRFVEENFLPSR
jgi:hypothetical protein